MQDAKQPGQQDTDKYTRWLLQYDNLTYQEKVRMCKDGIAYWQKQKYDAEHATSRVKTDIAKKRWTDRWDWTNTNENRWKNSLADCMVEEGVLKRPLFPF